MPDTFRGIVHGKHIELEEVPSIPEGSVVLVSIAPIPRSDNELRSEVLSLCGAWKNDPSISVIFDEIAQQRRTHRGRETRLP